MSHSNIRMSGYVHCACRDCFEIAIADKQDTSPALCHDCEDSGCEANAGECQSPTAYGCSEE